MRDHDHDTDHASEMDRLDRATHRRLARLGERPIDTARLEARLNDALAAPAAEPTPRCSYVLRRWLAASAGLAAALLVMLSVVVAFQSGTPTAQAAPIELARLHHDMVAGRLAVQPVVSVEQANAWIARQSADAPALPEAAAEVSVQSCCLTEVTGELVAVVRLDDGGHAVTLVVAEAEGFAMRMGTRYLVNGREVFGHAVDGVPMVMANIDDRWLCVMGDVPEARLAEIAGGVRF